MTEKLLRRPAVESATGLSRSTIYEMMAREDFPCPLRIGRRAVAWRESEILAWIDDRASREIISYR